MTVDISRLGGLELLRLAMAGEIPRAPIADTMGMEMASIEEGEATFLVTPEQRHLNPLGTVHGGFYATALDSATGCAVHTLLGPGDTYGTIELNVKMLKAVKLGTPNLRATGRVLHLSRQLGVADGRIVDDDGTLYAHATATCLIKRAG